MPSKQIKAVLIIASVVVLGAIGAIGASTWQSGKQDTQTDGLPNAQLTSLPSHRSLEASKNPIPVRVFKVGSIAPSKTQSGLTGVVRARHETNLAFRVSGKILRRQVEVGQGVGKGELLFELDSEDYSIQLRTAQANLDVAEAALRRAVLDEKRASELKRSNAISASEYEKSLSERDIAIGQHLSAEKQLELANNQLSYCRLVADESGVRR